MSSEIMKICILTTTRADYGLLRSLMDVVTKDQGAQLQIIATGQHFDEKHGNSEAEIIGDGFTIDVEIPLNLYGEEGQRYSSALSHLTAEIDIAFERLCPDIVVVLGDRFELIPIAQAAVLRRIPIAHIHGGEITEGAFDDSFRHAVSKMASLHFASLPEYGARLQQMGEPPETVFVVGGLGADAAHRRAQMSKDELETSLNVRFGERLFIVTYHPETLSDLDVEEQIDNLLTGIADEKDTTLLFTGPNMDPGGDIIREKILAFCKGRSDCHFVYSLGQDRYFSTLAVADAMVGNSSSGLLEASSFGLPVLNIGDRQRGRVAPDNVYHCENSVEAIRDGIRIIREVQDTPNHSTFYNFDKVPERILDIILSKFHMATRDGGRIQKAKFCDWSIEKQGMIAPSTGCQLRGGEDG